MNAPDYTSSGIASRCVREPDAFGRKQAALNDAVENGIGLLIQAARGETFAWALSSALSSIMTRYGQHGDLRPSPTSGIVS